MPKHTDANALDALYALPAATGHQRNDRRQPWWAMLWGACLTWWGTEVGAPEESLARQRLRLTAIAHWHARRMVKGEQLSTADIVAVMAEMARLCDVTPWVRTQMPRDRRTRSLD